MKNLHKLFWPTLFVVFFLSLLLSYRPYIPQYTIANTGIIHGVYPGGFSGEEDDFSDVDIISYERAVQKKAAFVYFSNNWYKSREFPKKMADMIYARNSIPYIRLMLRSNQFNQGHNEKEYTLERINNGIFDKDFRKWFNVAASYNKPMFAEFGVEVNGEWFNWNGIYNGGPIIGPNRFVSTYKRIINIAREEGATNILWSFHLDDDDGPDIAWNRFENYYPGDNYIDLVTVSIYGMLTSKDVQVRTIDEQLAKVYPRISAMAPNKNIMIIEWGSTQYNKKQKQETFVSHGFKTILSRKYPRVIGFSYWNEFWHNKTGPDSTMRVQDNPKLAKIFRYYLKTSLIDDSLLFEKGN
jgi:hypothetical protein